jgi:adenylyl- and sulfurtransferase ThiI
MGIMRNAYRILVERSERNTPLTRPRLSWEKNNIVDFKRKYGAYWTELA